MRTSVSDACTVPSIRKLAPLLLAVVGLGCAAPPTIAVTPIPEPTAPAEPSAPARLPPRELSPRVAAFSADRAWRDLQALSEIGPRPVGSRANERARDYLRAQLEQLGLSPESDEVEYASARPELAGAPLPSVINLSVTIPGTQSQERLLIVAPFDSQSFEDFEFIGVNDGASGAAVALEIARAIASHPLPYATEIAFLDGQSPFRALPDRPEQLREIGSFGVASRLAEQGSESIRLVVYINRVGDADLRIARDLMSHRIYREEFWKAASALGWTRAFPRDAPYENVGAVHAALSQIGVRQVVSIVDTSFGGDQPPGLYSGTAQDTLERCAPESLASVGEVVLEALDAISTRLAKLDRFAVPR